MTGGWWRQDNGHPKQVEGAVAGLLQDVPEVKSSISDYTTSLEEMHKAHPEFQVKIQSFLSFSSSSSLHMRPFFFFSANICLSGSSPFKNMYILFYLLGACKALHPRSADFSVYLFCLFLVRPAKYTLIGQINELPERSTAPWYFI